ncbi:MAG: NADH-quinone oxidoreductase subunit NuoB [Deltaproteobacteria bacterium]|nr:NADH-quinone oxidoreductase subunit NuoB [Deltaproteobacteria bacterium]MBW2383180.1 NADH-quinone oxidoreductase subunit NuoB [Deltaproteobacteria bacterium]MBW2696051.1 NADH-quinone oxidoreductase subunit NuoB [Deltaproteobacteria bacterium]
MESTSESDSPGAIPSWRPRGRPAPLGRLESVLAWARSHSLTLHPFVTSCCALDTDSLFGPRFDIERTGTGLPGSASRQADLLLVAGPAMDRRAAALRRAYEQMAEPKWVMAVGACACSGGIWEGYATGRSVGEIIPVDIYIPGCPPRPEAILHGLLELQRRIRGERIGREGRHREPPDSVPG